MKQAIPNIRATVAEMRNSLPSFPAAQQGTLDKFALSIAAELDILEGAKRDTGEPAVDTPAVDTPAVDTPAVDTPAVDTPAPAKSSTKAKASAAE